MESFLSAVPNGLSESERTALRVCLQSEIERLQKTGITGNGLLILQLIQGHTSVCVKAT